MARKAQTGAVLAFCCIVALATSSIGCAARATLSDGTQLEVDTRGNGSTVVTGTSDLTPDDSAEYRPDWPYATLRRIRDLWFAGKYAEAHRACVLLSRELKRRGRQSATPADSRQEDPGISSVLRNAREAGLE